MCDIVIIALYDDDLIFIGSNEKIIQDFKKDIMEKYEMSDNGPLKLFLGIEIGKWKMGCLFIKKL